MKQIIAIIQNRKQNFHFSYEKHKKKIKKLIIKTRLKQRRNHAIEPTF